MDAIISDGSGTPLTHEDIMISPAVATFSKFSNVPQSVIAIKDSDEEDTVLAGGPVVRNRIIMTKITQLNEECHNAHTGTDKENKSLKNILDLMFKEFVTEVDDEIDGIAMFILSIARLTKGTAYGLIIFHKGSTLLLETLSKKQVRHTWEEPVEKTEMLKIMGMKLTDEAVKEELRLLGFRKLKSILGRDKIFPSSDFTFFIPQDPDVF